MRTSKYSTPITNCEKNQGLDSVKAIKKAQEIVLHCAAAYEEAHMYSLVIVGSQSVADYRWAYNSMAEKLRDFGFKAEFFGAIEHEEEKGGLHCHCYFIIECVDANPAGVKRVSKAGTAKVVKIMSTQTDSWFKKTLAKRGMRFHISEPQNEVHRTRLGKKPMYARPTLKGGRLADCLTWASYPYKKRSKAEAKKKSREIYFFSEFESNKAKQELKGNEIEEVIAETPELSPIGSLPGANQEAASSTAALVDARPSASGSEEARSKSEASTGDERHSASRASPYYERTEMTPAQKFLASLYEQCVDADMDTEQVRRYLLDKGIRKTPYQVVDDLDNVFQFTSYAVTHQPRPQLGLVEWDRMIDRA